MALQTGHPCYFIGFLPEPVEGQTIEDVMAAEAHFLKRVQELHPKAVDKPFVIANCQAGWAILMLAAVRPELFGPLLVAGAPGSYWAGERGGSPMRYAGGLLGGSWLTALAGDLGHGRFDGAHLVANFENMNPANTLWTKQYNVWSKADTEGPRYLEFERWWGGHVELNAEEIQFIVDRLFVGNQLATAEIVTRDGDRIDLRNIKGPIVVFCSRGDDITPPPQALGWIWDLYDSEADLLAHGQTIVYAVHDRIGHLGIFVSGSVARKKHEEFAENIDLIDVLPPGLYEAVLSSKNPEASSADLVTGEWIVRFERRTFAQPWVKAMASAGSTDWLKRMHPLRLGYEMFSDANPLMRGVKEGAAEVREQRRPASPGDPFLAWQTMFSEQMAAGLQAWGQGRDRMSEAMFYGIYGSPLLQAIVGLRSSDGPPRARPGDDPAHLAFVRQRTAELRSQLTEGGVLEAFVRALLYVGGERGAFDERFFALLRRIRGERGDGLDLARFKRLLREQSLMLHLDEEAALDGLRVLLAEDPTGAGAALAVMDRITATLDLPEGDHRQRYERVRRLFEEVAGEAGSAKVEPEAASAEERAPAARSRRAAS